MATRTATPIYQLKITLKGIRPPIWRRVQVAGNIGLADLHDVIQTAMGWYDYHLHAFTIGGETYYGDQESALELGGRTTGRTRLNQVADCEGARLRYEYDFGDSWEHEVLVEKILPVEPGQRYPRCLAGRRACPPEDVGGVWGYAEFLEAIANPDHEDHDDLLAWAGDDFDPEAFDLAGTDEALREPPSAG
jgi:hypothetical protein